MTETGQRAENGTAIRVFDSEPAVYIMGRTERERKRLLLQGSILNTITRRFLRQAGLRQGMRVLDLGCGIGDVSLIAAEITGCTGSVTGIDVDDAALDIARQRAREQECHHLCFENADLNHYLPDELFDAVVARHLLIHTADPFRVVRKAESFVVPGGLAAFQEYDLSFWPRGYPETPLASRLAAAVVELFQRVTPHANIGMRLCHLLQQGGFSILRSSAECVMEAGSEENFYAWFAETIRSLFPAMEKFGLVSDIGPMDTLAKRLRSETLAAGGCLVSPLVVSASGRKA